MFTIEQIKSAHAKVKSGADFPNYIREIAAFGVTTYETFVKDGHADYFGNNDYRMSSAPKYDTLAIAEKSNTEQFKSDLKAHQEGKTDYPTFCTDAAKSGVEKWTVSLDKMTCTYFDKSGEKMLVEQIPE